MTNPEQERKGAREQEREQEDWGSSTRKLLENHCQHNLPRPQERQQICDKTMKRSGDGVIWESNDSAVELLCFRIVSLFQGLLLEVRRM